MASPRPPWPVGCRALAVWLLVALVVGAAVAVLVWIFVVAVAPVY